MKKNRRIGLRRSAARFEAMAMRIFVGLVLLTLVCASALTKAGVINPGECGFAAAGTPCTEHDGNVCTCARCDGSGNCVDPYPGSFCGGDCTSIWDGNECTEPLCDTSGHCGRPKPADTFCTEHDGNVCTCARCDGHGVCEDPSPGSFCGGDCTSIWDGNECTEPRCNTTGHCGRPLPSGTDCTDQDGNICTIAQCDGSGHCKDCDASGCSFRGGPCTNWDGNECTEPFCGNTLATLGHCGRPKAAGSPCTDLVNECTEPVCDNGTCGRPKAAGTDCTDHDGNICTIAQCDGSGHCHDDCEGGSCFFRGGPCPDTDGNDCTEAACNTTGNCDQNANADTTPPNITCPPDVTVRCGDATGEATATDNRDPAPEISHSDNVVPTNDPANPVQEVIHRTWTATDVCHNSDDCVQDITVLKRTLFLDIKPGSCPNALDIRARGLIPISLLGTADFNVNTVNVASLRLVRADGVGGAVAPTNWSLQDTGTPFGGQLCGCHRLTGDRIVDLSLKFDNLAVVSALQLSTVAPNASVPLVLSGTLSDGCKFIAGDCMVRTPVKGR